MRAMSALSRRRFIDILAVAPVAAVLPGVAAPAQSSPLRQATSTSPGAPPDMPRSVSPSRADFGSNFAAVRALDAGAIYPGSFLSGRFASLDAFTAAGRASILGAYGYRPAAVAAAPEVVDRYDVPHQFNVQMQEDAFAWLDAQLRPAR